MIVFSDLVGKTLVAWEVGENKDELVLSFSDGTAYMLYHDQDCCESVTLEDVCGDPDRTVRRPAGSGVREDE